MAEQKFKTGEKAPEQATYEVLGLVKGGRGDGTTIDLQEGDTFPPVPSNNEAAYWVKISK